MNDGVADKDSQVGPGFDGLQAVAETFEKSCETRAPARAPSRVLQATRQPFAAMKPKIDEKRDHGDQTKEERYSGGPRNGNQVAASSAAAAVLFEKHQRKTRKDNGSRNVKDALEKKYAEHSRHREAFAASNEHWAHWFAGASKKKHARKTHQRGRVNRQPTGRPERAGKTDPAQRADGVAKKNSHDGE